MSQPNFLIVGAAKSGTTTLHDLLTQHPEIFLPEKKELLYFAGGRESGLSTWDQYLSYFRSSEGSNVIGEASVAYLYDPKAPGQIEHCLGPSTRIVISLRNPVDMMYSLWGHMRRIRREELGFFDALAAEDERMLAEIDRHSGPGLPYDRYYLHRARYFEQVRRYIEVFGRPQVFVAIFEHFFSNLPAAIQELYRFLGADGRFVPDVKHLNPAGVFRSPSLYLAVNRSSVVKELLKGMLPSKWRAGLKSRVNTFNRRAQDLPALTSSQRRELWDMVKDDVTALERLLDGKLTAVWEPR